MEETLVQRIGRLGIRQSPRPFLHEWPKTDEEARALAVWQVAEVENMVDASLEFIEQELRNAGFSPCKAKSLTQEIEKAVFPVWASIAFGSDFDGQWEAAEVFLCRRFGLRRHIDVDEDTDVPEGFTAVVKRAIAK